MWIPSFKIFCLLSEARKSKPFMIGKILSSCSLCLVSMISFQSQIPKSRLWGISLRSLSVQRCLSTPLNVSIIILCFSFHWQSRYESIDSRLFIRVVIAVVPISSRHLYAFYDMISSSSLSLIISESSIIPLASTISF